MEIATPWLCGSPRADARRRCLCARAQYAGRIFASKVQRYQDLVPLLLQRTGLPPGTPLLVYEEVKFEPQLMCDLQTMSHTLAQAQLEDGDILCVQAEPAEVRARALA
jgi:ubiquitin carboxyl-terminal hydrolase 7